MEMAVKRLYVTLDETVAERASQAAERHGRSLSTWLNAAAERALIIEDGLVAVAEYEAENGAPSQEADVWADTVLSQIGVRDLDWA